MNRSTADRYPFDQSDRRHRKRMRQRVTQIVIQGCKRRDEGNSHRTRRGDTDSDIDHSTTTPANLMKQAAFMHKVGHLKRLSASWKDLFFVEANDLGGT